LERHLHIISFDVPYPADYGGVVDVFCTIKGLHAAGVQVHLHCFEYGRGEQPELEQYCTSVHYYPRLTGHKCVSAKLPYIVASRSSPALLDNLLKDDHPILAQGIHCTYLLLDERFKDRKVIVRLFNTEYTYYEQLYKATAATSLFKKLYYHHESKMLRQYERQIIDKALFLSLSEQDVTRYRQELGAKKIAYLPPLLPYNEVTGKEGVGCFCLYHGNLSVAENEKAALWLLEEVFNDLSVPFVIAGKEPSRKLERAAEEQGHCCMVANPSEKELQDMIGKAQINILPSFNCTGIKLKLLNALFNGRHCVVNEATVHSTGLEAACHTGNNAVAFKSLVMQLYNQPFTEEETRLRKKILCHSFDNARNVQRLIQWIW
jgi:hypothetical protein